MDIFEVVCEAIYWLILTIVCAVTAALGYFVPFYGPSIVLALVGIVAVVGTYGKTDVVQGIFLFVIAPLVGTLFIEPGLSLSQYEWLLGIWAASFILGCLLAYFMQRGRKPKAHRQDLIATVH